MKQRQVLGDYRLEQQLGSGAFGEVWLASSTTNPDQRDALKFARAAATNAEVMKEVDSWKKASGHENIVDFKGSFKCRVEGESSDRIVLVSEYLPDGSLFDWLQRHRRASPELAARMLCDILTGLDHLHGNRISHRDLKPSNILLKGDTLKLVDFGAARLLDFHKESHIMQGTPRYMAPEAFNADRRPHVDIWSAGIILYELVAGSVPFDEEDLAELTRMIVEDAHRPLPSGTPEPITRIVDRVLTKQEPLRRPSAAEMKDALLQWLGENPDSAFGTPSTPIYGSQPRSDDPTFRLDGPTEKKHPNSTAAGGSKT